MSVADIAKDVIKHWGDADIVQVRNIPRADMIRYHSSVGRSIRNEYKLWDKKNPLTKQWVFDGPLLVDGADDHPCHPDAVSMDVLYKIWDIVHERN